MRRYFFIFYVILAVILLSGAKVVEKGKWREPLYAFARKYYIPLLALGILATILHALDRKLIGIVKKRLPDF